MSDKDTNKETAAEAPAAAKLKAGASSGDAGSGDNGAGDTGARRTGLIVAFLVFGVFGVWATTAPIDGASHAPGTVAVSSYNKMVQHLEGGIIAEIFVDNGTVVRRGDPLVALDPTQALAQLEMVNAQLRALMALEARLLAERDGNEEIEFPAELREGGSAAQAEMASQTRIFEARRFSLEGQIELLEQRMRRLRSQSSGLEEMRESNQDLLTSYREELEEVRGLLADGFSDTTRLRQVQRNHDTTRSDLAQLRSEIAATEMQAIEAETEIRQLQRDFRAEVVTQLGETESRIKELLEQRRANEDIYGRQVVRATDNGIINGMEMHTIGGVVPPGSTIAEIVPEGEELIIEARVSPNDIDRVAVGQEASVTLTAYSAQTTPRLTGTVIRVSADAMMDENSGETFYLARVNVSPEELAELDNVVLVPGMPADVFISSGERTLMQYLLKPLTTAMQRSFIED